MRTRQIIAVVLLLIGSSLPNLLWPSSSTLIVQIAVLSAAAAGLLLSRSTRPLCVFALVLAVINASWLLMGWIGASHWWPKALVLAGPLGEIGSTIARKVVGIVPVLAALLLLLRSRRQAYLRVGDLSAKADAIPWLGIRAGRIGWGRLAPIAGLLIALGTFLLTLITAVGFAVPRGLGRLVASLPLIMLLALVNSFCEGIVYRNAVMGPLREHLPKCSVVLLSALFFGIAHYQGIPGGLLGSVMSGALGWFMARSMYETEGLASAWLIHLAQDITIFASVVAFS